jgi:dCTP deaminase
MRQDLQAEERQPRLVISDFDHRRLNPNSYNLRLAPELKVYEKAVKWSNANRPPQEPMGPGGGSYVLDARADNQTRDLVIPEDGFVLEPGVLYLGRTTEYTESHGVVPCIEGRSSIGRLGICVHVTAGFGDVGFCGTWTLEITAVHPVRVYAGMEICQICYTTVSANHEPYRGKYQGQQEVVPSRMHQDFEVSHDGS